MARVARKSVSSYSEPAAAKLASSGLGVDVALELGIEESMNAAAWHKTLHPIQAIRLPYYDLEGKDSGFYRVRYLGVLPGFLGSLEKPQRYAQPPGTLNWVYLPRMKGMPWSQIANDATVPLLITEGELKAACACNHDYPTIALGGVSVWQSSKKSVPLLPPLDQFTWKNRQVTIVFDSDAATNPNVAASSVRLAKELLRLGAVPKVATLPAAVNGDKQGLDDFLVAGQDLDAVIDEARPLGLGDKLVSFNERYSYVVSQNVIINLETAARLKRDDFVNGLHANVREIEFVPTAQGSLKRVELSVPREWLEWSSRRDVGDIVYKPGAPRITREGDYNAWPGWGCEAIKGNVEPWNKFMTYIFETSPSDRKWFEQWLAYPLQHPGTKLYTACLLWSPEHGAGKSLVGVVMGRIYGRNYTLVENSDLFTQFNEWSVNKQFVLGDEISGSDKRAESDKLKGLITRPLVRINVKHLPTYEVVDCINYFFTSNHCDSLFLEDRDRRNFIHRLPSYLLTRQFFIAFMKWLDEQGGKEALFHYLLNLDLKGFDPGGPAPVTQAKLEMADHSKSDVGAFAQDVRRNLDDYLARLQQLLHLKVSPDIVRNSHLLFLYDPDGKTRVTSNGLGRALATAGFKTVFVNNTLAFGTQRVYVMRNADKWLNAKPEVLRAYIDSIYPPPTKKG